MRRLPQRYLVLPLFPTRPTQVASLQPFAAPARSTGSPRRRSRAESSLHSPRSSTQRAMPAARSVSASSVIWPASTSTGVSRGPGRQRTDDLAVQRIVEAALTGDDELGRRDVVGQAGVFGDHRGARLPSATQREQRGTDAPGRARTGFCADVAARHGVQFRGPLGQPGLQQHHGGRVGALLRSEHRRRAHRAEQRMLDVGGRDQLDARQPGTGGGQPAERVDQRTAAVGAATAAEADDDAVAPRRRPRRRSAGRLPRCGPRAPSRRWADRRAAPGHRPAHTRRRRSPTLSSNTHSAVTSSASGPLTRCRAQLAQPTGQHADETGAAVGLRRGHQRVVPSGAAPACSDRLGGLTAVRLSP